MDKHLTKREYRLRRAVEQRNTTTQWDHIAAAIEDANIEFHGLVGAEAKKMKGRSRTTFQKKMSTPSKRPRDIKATTTLSPKPNG